MIRLALSDMDNTLVPFGQERVNPIVLDAISTLQAEGVQFGPATGRDEQELYRFFSGKSFAYNTGILSNGKKVKIDGEIVWRKLIDNEVLDRLAKTFLMMPNVFIVAYPAKTDTSNPAYVIGAKESEMAAFEARFKFNGIWSAELPDVEIMGATIAVIGDMQLMEKVRDLAKAISPEFDYVSPVPNWFDIIPHGVSKASAFDILCKELGIKPEEAVFFGDAENDLQIMAKTPNSVAVANATEAAAAAANYHIGPCTQDAVAHALLDLATATKEGQLPAFLQ